MHALLSLVISPVTFIFTFPFSQQYNFSLLILNIQRIAYTNKTELWQVDIVFAFGGRAEPVLPAQHCQRHTSVCAVLVQ